MGLPYKEGGAAAECPGQFLPEHHHRDFAQAQHGAGGGSDDQGANAGMAIGAHDQQVDGLAVDDVGNYRVGLAGDDIRMVPPS